MQADITDVGTNRKPLCDFLLVMNSNLHPILHRFEVITDYSNCGRKTATFCLWGPFEELRGNIHCSS